MEEEEEMGWKEGEEGGRNKEIKYFSSLEKEKERGRKKEAIYKSI